MTKGSEKVTKVIEGLRDKTRRAGAELLQTSELLALVLHSGAAGEDSLALAELLLQQFEGLEGIAQASLDALTQIPGIGPARATRLQAALALGRRLALAMTDEHPLIRRPSDAVRLLQRHLSALPQEQLVILLLDTHNRVVELQTVYIGSLNMTVVRVSEIFRPAILRNSAGILLAHTHPSGDVTPSPEDIDLTQAVVAAGKLLDIAVIDHLIIGRGQWVSLRERGLGFQGEADAPGV
jgi:DNA repair protein RadC